MIVLFIGMVDVIGTSACGPGGGEHGACWDSSYVSPTTKTIPSTLALRWTNHLHKRD